MRSRDTYSKDCNSGALLYHISVVGTIAASIPSLSIYISTNWCCFCLWCLRYRVCVCVYTTLVSNTADSKTPRHIANLWILVGSWVEIHFGYWLRRDALCCYCVMNMTTVSCLTVRNKLYRRYQETVLWTSDHSCVENIKALLSDMLQIMTLLYF